MSDEIDLSMYELPKGTLTGDEAANSVETVHYNNVDYKDYREFLIDWIAYYETCNIFTKNQYDDRTLEEYRKELALLSVEEKPE